MQKVSTYYTFVCHIYDYHFFDYHFFDKKVTTMTQVTLFSYNPSRTHVIFIFLRGTREKLRNSCHMCHHCHQQ